MSLCPAHMLHCFPSICSSFDLSTLLLTVSSSIIPFHSSVLAFFFFWNRCSCFSISLHLPLSFLRTFNFFSTLHLTISFPSFVYCLFSTFLILFASCTMSYTGFFTNTIRQALSYLPLQMYPAPRRLAFPWLIVSASELFSVWLSSHPHSRMQMQSLFAARCWTIGRQLNFVLGVISWNDRVYAQLKSSFVGVALLLVILC